MLFKIISSADNTLLSYFSQKIVNLPDYLQNFKDNLYNNIICNWDSVGELQKENLEFVINWLAAITAKNNLHLGKKFIDDYCSPDYNKTQFAYKLIALILSNQQIVTKDLSVKFIDSCNPIKMTLSQFARFLYFSLGGEWKNN